MESLRQGYSLPSPSCNISNTRDIVLRGYPNSEKRVQNTTCSGVLLTKAEMFRQPMKQNNRIHLKTHTLSLTVSLGNTPLVVSNIKHTNPFYWKSIALEIRSPYGV